MSVRGHNNRRSFPAWLFRHSSLSEKMRAGLEAIDAEELSKVQYYGLCILVESVVETVVPGLHRQYPGRGVHEGVGLCAEMLHEEFGFGAGEIEKAHEFLGKGKFERNTERLTPNKLLSFYFKLRETKRAAELARAKALFNGSFHENTGTSSPGIASRT